MRKLFISILFLSSFHSAFSQKESCEDKQHPYPVFKDQEKLIVESNLAQAKKKYINDSTNAENIIWYGRRTAYAGNYKEAIDIYTKGISLYRTNARYYRHRGHRYITLRCFDKAIDDLKKATDYIKDQIDEMEQDGIPNAANTPTGSLFTNIWYHLGLAYYFNSDYKNAVLAFRRCVDLADNNDMIIAGSNWLNISFRKSGKTKEADQVLSKITGDMDIIENFDYLDILLMYKTGDDSKVAEKVQNQETGNDATLGYALGNYYLLKGKKEKAKELFEKVVAGNQWASFGFIGAEIELAKMK